MFHVFLVVKRVSTLENVYTLILDDVKSLNKYFPWLTKLLVKDSKNSHWFNKKFKGFLEILKRIRKNVHKTWFKKTFTTFSKMFMS